MPKKLLHFTHDPNYNCSVCSTPMTKKRTGRPRKTCTDRCRQIVYRHNKQLRTLQQDFFQRNPSAAGPQDLIRNK